MVIGGLLNSWPLFIMKCSFFHDDSWTAACRWLKDAVGVGTGSNDNVIDDGKKRFGV